MTSLFQKLVLSLFMKATPLKPGIVDKTNKKAVLIYEIGRLQVYHFQSAEEIARGDAPKQVYWQDKESRHTYGPFSTIYEATKHYRWTVMSQKVDSTGSVGNIVYVDFAKKKRIVVGGTPNDIA